MSVGDWPGSGAADLVELRCLGKFRPHHLEFTATVDPALRATLSAFADIVGGKSMVGLTDDDFQPV